MTEPDPIAALAAQLEQLRGQIGSLRARHSEDYGHVMVLMLEVRKPGEKIDAAIARRQAGEPRRRTAPACPATSTRSSPAPCGSGPGRSPVSSSRRTWPRVPRLLGRRTRRRPGSSRTSWRSRAGSTATRTTGTCRAPCGGLSAGSPAPWRASVRRSGATRPAAACPGPRRGSRLRPAIPDRPEGPGVLPLRRGSPRQHEHVRRSMTTAAARPSSAGR